MKRALLICALALRPISFPPIQEDKWYEEIVAYLQECYPHKQIWLIKDMEVPDNKFEKLPHITYRGYGIYLERKSA